MEPVPLTTQKRVKQDTPVAVELREAVVVCRNALSLRTELPPGALLEEVRQRRVVDNDTKQELAVFKDPQHTTVDELHAELDKRRDIETHY